jgi:hypothetical protein
MAAASTTAAIMRRSNAETRTVDRLQQYAPIMESLLKTHFKLLGSAPDAHYVMMATMMLESSAKMTPSNHQAISPESDLGVYFVKDNLIAKYWNSFNSQPPNVQSSLQEGLSAKALMATMGLYQFRNTQACREIISSKHSQPHYPELVSASGYDILVEVGQNPSSKFTEDAELVGATRSMMFGCMIMEVKYNIYLKSGCTPATAMYKAMGAYVGKDGAKDALGTSPDDRRRLISDSNDPRIILLAKAGITRSSGNSVVYNRATAEIRPKAATVHTEAKTTAVAQTNNVVLTTSGCRRVSNIT